ncbi:473f76ea-36e8-4d94-b6b3-0e51f96bf0da [Sclerotinia trifoliorum]|uniref:473f76ea-36e8-4d94-b6b3-0e51f96bf0da n=1 Tax=Sclerotinia trifoliorum TaxID=28548 RepID=A0A8H2W1Y0_9HELO|nr:473f76ea-36e8-4d94-b6b3-0e51f96bf0da [Sclerotinia trifoliorum]
MGDISPDGLEDLNASDQPSSLISSPDDEPNNQLGDQLLLIKIRHKNIIDDIIYHHKHPETERLKYILGEYLRGDSYHYISLCPINGDIENAFACIEGPNLSPYEGGIFWLHIYFPMNYPSHPPKMRFLTPICHPDIDDNGEFYLQDLSLEEDGYVPPIYTQDILWSVFEILDEPDFKEFEFKNSRISEFDDFLQRAAFYTKEYAMADEPDETKLVKDWLEHFDQKSEVIQGSDAQEADDDAPANATVETCRIALINWRQQIWETRKEDQFKDIESIIPRSAIITISNNLDRLSTNEVQLEQLDLEEWDARTQFLEEHSDSSIRKLLKDVFDHCVNVVVQQLVNEREDAMQATMIEKHERTWNPMWFR